MYFRHEAGCDPQNQLFRSPLIEILRIVFVFLQVMAFCKVICQTIKNAIVKCCTFENDTSYTVMIVDHDGTRALHPGTSQGNYLVIFQSVDLVLKLPDGDEETINFPSSKFENRTHKISYIFADAISKYENTRALESVNVIQSFSTWQLTYSHPGGFEAKAITKMVTKNSWKDMQEKGYEAETKVGAMIKAIELSASFKAYTKLTRVDECERAITRSIERTFEDPCYLWQEIIVVKTDQAPPFDELRIPTANTAMTTTNHEPGKEKFVCSTSSCAFR